MILFNCFTSKINRLLLQELVWTFIRKMWYAIIKESLSRKRFIRIWFRWINKYLIDLMARKAHVRHVFAVPAFTFVATLSVTDMQDIFQKIVSVKLIRAMFVSKFLIARRRKRRNSFEPTNQTDVVLHFFSWELDELNLWVRLLYDVFRATNHR